MSWRDAPLYVEAHDLARWLLERTNAWPADRDRSLCEPLTRASCDLVESVSLALTFPGGRAEHLRRADEAVVRVRVLLRLGRDVGLLSPGGVRHAAGHLRTIGRILGGWRKRHRERAPPFES